MADPALYAIVQDSDGLVVNIVMWDGEAAWSPPAGTTAVAVGAAAMGIGWWYDAGEFFRLPSISSVDPITGPAAGGTTVTVEGTNLDYGTVVVKFGGVAATNIQNKTNVSLDCDTPAHDAGAVDVTVENEKGSWSGQDTLAGGFTYT